jgi:hypothetical protein
MRIFDDGSQVGSCGSLGVQISRQTRQESVAPRASQPLEFVVQSCVC